MSWPVLTDYQEAVQNPGFCFNDPELRNSCPEINIMGLPKAISGNFAVVFPMIYQGRKWAVRCFTTHRSDQERRYDIISNYLRQHYLQYMVAFEFQKKGIRIRGQWYPILKMEWVDGDPLNLYIEKNLNNPHLLANLAEKFLDMMSELKQLSIAHGDLQHGNILVVNDNLRLVDYDGMFVPGLESFESQEIGHRHYQHPHRSKYDFGAHIDNFSAWVIFLTLIALSLDPSLWQSTNAGEEHLLFSQKDFEYPDFSIVKDLLEQVPDSNFQKLLSDFWSFVNYTDLKQIPFLDKSLQIQKIQPGQKLVGLPEWIVDLQRQAKDTASNTKPAQGQSSVAQSETTSDSSWILDHIEPEPLISISTPCFFERLSLVSFIGALVYILYCLATGLILPSIGISAIGSGLGLVLLMLVIRYRSLPELAEKQVSLQNLRTAESEREQSENLLNQLNNEKDLIKNDENRQIEMLQISQNSSLARERQELEKSSRDLHKRLMDLDGQYQTTIQSESVEINQALQKIQWQFIENRLKAFSITNAQITGIGPELKRRLQAHGIKTAADIAAIHITPGGWGTTRDVAWIEVPGQGRINVYGIGPIKANELWYWRQSIESMLKNSVPKSLPKDQENAIRQKYASQRQLLKNQIESTKQKFEREKIMVQQKYKQERETISKKLQDTRKTFARKYADIDRKITEEKNRLNIKRYTETKARLKFESYQKINFKTYIKRIMFLEK